MIVGWWYVRSFSHQVFTYFPYAIISDLYVARRAERWSCQVRERIRIEQLLMDRSRAADILVVDPTVITVNPVRKQLLSHTIKFGAVSGKQLPSTMARFGRRV